MNNQYIFPVGSNIFWFNVVFQLLFILSETIIGVYIVSAIIYLIIIGYFIYALYLKQFAKITAKVISTNLIDGALFVIVDGRATNSVGYRPSIKYSYEIDGKAYVSDRFTPYKNDKYYTVKNHWKTFLNKISKDKQLIVYYNPKKASQSYVTVEMSDGLKLAFVFNAALSTIALIYVFITI